MRMILSEQRRPTEKVSKSDRNGEQSIKRAPEVSRMMFQNEQ